ncbi:hypothetical protein PF008_g33415 [Phytophthora fragariae]|uniref:Secreted protein n=1 Tax=Phytophthora fragariae TaxID=53985 RepID=A0A6G0PWZ1_9STRA|nr:hypothetical protein PF008_g33415 [Phytophthora fragariae]
MGASFRFKYMSFMCVCVVLWDGENHDRKFSRYGWVREGGCWCPSRGSSLPQTMQRLVSQLERQYCTV